jgi:hypothetical protein
VVAVIWVVHPVERVVVAAGKDPRGDPYKHIAEVLNREIDFIKVGGVEVIAGNRVPRMVERYETTG